MQLGIDDSVEAVFPPEALKSTLNDLAPETGVRIVDDELGNCAAVVTFDHREAFLDSVDWVHSIQAGVDKFPQTDYDKAGVALTNSSGIHGASVGETVIGFMTMLARGLHHYVRAGAEHNWSVLPWDRPFTLEDESVCVVGLGTIGQGVAERATWMGMDVLGVRRSPNPVPIVDELYTADELHAALLNARFVVLAVPLTTATRRMFGPAELTAMRDDAFLINVARGPVVVENALVDAIENDEIGGAALDVFGEEPLPEDSPLWDLDEVIVTPHSAARTNTYHEDIADLVLENIERIEDGREFRNRVV